VEDEDYPGTFIVIEGPDGAGTTTQSKKLAEELDAYWTAEPTDGKTGQKVEEMIRSDDYSAESIALAFAADRMIHLEEDVKGKLKNGEVVVSDRYYHSSLVYQPAFGAKYEWVELLNKNALRPDITLVLDASSEEAFSRLRDRENGKINQENFDDKNQASLDMFSLNSEVVFEEMDFQKEVAKRYRKLDDILEEEIILVNASGSIDQVFNQILKNISELGVQ